jgi:hypothetical protein
MRRVAAIEAERAGIFPDHAIDRVGVPDYHVEDRSRASVSLLAAHIARAYPPCRHAQNCTLSRKSAQNQRYRPGEAFAAAVDADIRTFLNRRSEATPLLAARSWEFILEEAAGEILLARHYPCARFYPGRERATLTALRRGVAGAPKGLERSAYYRLTLETAPAGLPVPLVA